MDAERSVGSGATSASAAAPNSGLMNEPARPLSVTPAPLSSRRTFAFHGTAAEFYPLFVRTVLLSIVTLGIYSFWGRAQMRRYLVSHLEFDGDRFEYHGTGGEMLRGALKLLAMGGLWFGIIFGASLLIPSTPEGEPADAGGALLSVVVVWVPLLLVWPFLVASSWRYRASRTSWRGIRFSYRGSMRGFYGSWFKWLGIAIAMLGYGMPLFRARVRRYLIGHSYFGNLPFESTEDGSGLATDFFLGGLLAYPTLGYMWQRFRAMERDHSFVNTSIEKATLWYSGTAGGLWKLNVAMTALIIVTLGLAWPWKEIMRYQYFAETTSLYGTADLDRAVQQMVASPASADEFDGILDDSGSFGLEI